MSDAEAALPSFRYHPEPLETGSIARRDDACIVCERSRGFVYVGPVIAEDDLDDCVCPWCIADGSAAERFGAKFTDVGWGVPADVPPAVLDELSQRTPGFTGWQQEHWLYHCADAAAFLGLAGWQELEQYTDAVETLRVERLGLGWSAHDTEEYLTALHREGDFTAYLFRCLHCGTRLAYSDST